MKRSIGIVVGSTLAIASLVTIGIAPSANAQGAVQSGVQAARGDGVPVTLFGDAGVITTITNTLLFIAGVLAVIMIMWGGLRYVTSAGNPANVTAAKNTILYAVIGLIISFLAFAIVNWVLVAVTQGAGGAAGFTNV